MENISSNLRTIKRLKENKCSEVPEKNGIYVVISPENFAVEFAGSAFDLLHAELKEYKKYCIKELEAKFCQSDRQVLYIGKASGKGGLKKRIRQYIGMKFNHRGGRAIWHIKDSHELLIGYCECENPEEKEKEMLKSYKDKHSVYPVANQRR
ncbi:MAG: GIY-YIG nuclease family protein [Clostridiales bacterium]|nr:GIY-YIG nuclease family protein [Clostridiales bacterium]